MHWCHTWNDPVFLTCGSVYGLELAVGIGPAALLDVEAGELHQGGLRSAPCMLLTEEYHTQVRLGIAATMLGRPDALLPSALSM